MNYPKGREFLAELQADYDRQVAQRDQLNEQLQKVASELVRLEAAIKAVLAVLGEEPPEEFTGVGQTPEDEGSDEEEVEEFTRRPDGRSGRKHYPYLKDSMLSIMAGSGGRPWTIHELLDEIYRRGQLNPHLSKPPDAARTAATRLVHEGALRKIGPSTYVLQQPYLDGMEREAAMR